MPTHQFQSDNSRVKSIGDVAKGGGFIERTVPAPTPVTSKKAQAKAPPPAKTPVRNFQASGPTPKIVSVKTAGKGTVLDTNNRLSYKGLARTKR